MRQELADWRARAQYFAFEGHRIAYWRSGSGGGSERGSSDRSERPLVLVHGFPTASWDWAAVWDRLGARHSLIAADMIGFGLSDKPRGGYSIHRQADMQLALLRELGIREFDLLVHDYGVSVGQEILARQLEGSGAPGLNQVVFLNGGIFPDQHRPRPMQRLGVSPIGFLVGRLLNRARFGTSFSAVFGPDTQPSERELDEFWSLIVERDGHRIFHKLLHYIADRRRHETRWVGALTEAQGRIGLINGALDPVSGEHAWRKWRETLPNAREKLLPNVGHYPQVEAPDAVATTVLKWLR